MRHVPTCLYLDTQVFIHGDDEPHFDTRLFTELKNTFIPKGLRLLVPEMMERELLRKCEKRAKKLAEDITKSHDNYHIKKLGLIKLPSETDLEKQFLEEMKRQWSDFQGHFVIERLPLVGNLEEVVDWYFGNLPPFSTKPKEFPDAFIISVLDAYHKKHHASQSRRGCCQPRPSQTRYSVNRIIP